MINILKCFSFYRASFQYLQLSIYMGFNQRGDICTLKGGSLKLVDKFTQLGSSISSIENDINTLLAKAWTAINMLYGNQT